LPVKTMARMPRLERVAVNRIQRMARTHLLRKRCLGPPADYMNPIDRNTL